MRQTSRSKLEHEHRLLLRLYRGPKPGLATSGPRGGTSPGREDGLQACTVRATSSPCAHAARTVVDALTR